ncbi:hypothetical protein MLD38_002964 [Melastoma candidum]|uniref:Uncharacterized protein n=1 Tax=Melastoma candidum TaxID=119954 RepID=A0ACB9S0S7_9MYRT|nr:hypothetical protein MLD38_002964 [Melastoma candidum]
MVVLVMGSTSFHRHLGSGHHGHGDRPREPKLDVPKGCLAVIVGADGEQQQRFVIPVIYLNHPLFLHLLKEAEEEYGFDQKGPITIPCHVSEFRNVQDSIDRECGPHHHHHHHHQSHGNGHHDGDGSGGGHHHHHHHHAWCFGV